MCRTILVSVMMGLPVLAQIKASDITGAITDAGKAAQQVRANGEIPAWHLAGINAAVYDIALDREQVHGGRQSAYLHCIQRNCEGIGELVQSIRADNYRGKSIRLTAWLKTDEARGAGIFLRVDGAGQRTRDLGSTSPRRSQATKDWEKETVELDVPKSATEIFFGVTLSGKGAAWVDDFSLELVESKMKRSGTDSAGRNAKTPTTEEGLRIAALSDAPENIDFEK
jgi:hypothetical protein